MDILAALGWLLFGISVVIAGRLLKRKNEIIEMWRSEARRIVEKVRNLTPEYGKDDE